MPLVVWSPPRSSIMVGRQARDENLLTVGHALAVVVMVDAQVGRMQDPEFPSW